MYDEENEATGPGVKKREKDRENEEKYQRENVSLRRQVNGSKIIRKTIIGTRDLSEQSDANDKQKIESVCSRG